MSLLTVSELRSFVESDLSDDAIQMLIDDNELFVDNSIGEYDIQTDERIIDKPAIKKLFLQRRANSITSIDETVNDTTTTLSTDDYSLKLHGVCVERLSTGTNPRCAWGEYVKIIYVPKSDMYIRKGVIIDLIKLQLAYNGQSREEMGDYKTQAYQNYNDERKR